ncbi:hypothetical protein KKB28_03625 [bacterium]|nr:hypothetical protein [bacterium]
MNLQVKPALIIIGTLLIGIVLGALMSGTLADRRHRKIGEMMRPNMFSERLIEVIEPLEPDQREAITAIVEETATRVQNLTRETRFEMHAVMDSMFSELRPLLTDEQSLRLERHLGDARARIERMESHREHDRMGRGRPRR